jgi:hypothetical protein
VQSFVSYLPFRRGEETSETWPISRRAASKGVILPPHTPICSTIVAVLALTRAHAGSR